MSARVGSGVDAHRLVPGCPLVLGGVELAFPSGLAGHSDGDVVSHAIADAVLGAVGAGDLGSHFPSDDAQWKGASSLLFLERVATVVAERGGSIMNVDVTLILQAPKVADAVPQMRKAVGEALGISPEQVSIKATTTDHLGFTGQGQGAAAIAVALVEVPSR